MEETREILGEAQRETVEDCKRLYYRGEIETVKEIHRYRVERQ